tara:strand:+ start:3032 stop:3748 length:717 start_codon:yes stop_codon:yes gene_type:complete
MPKAPAFQFYAQDFLTGVMDLTMDERGLYITLLARQWAIFDEKGIPKKRLALLVGFEWDNLPEMIKEKFDDNGDYFFNSRLMESFKQLKSYKEKQRLNGQKGGRPKTQTITKKRSSLKIEDRSMKNEDRKKKIEVEAIKPYQTENFDIAWDNWKEYKRLELGFNYKTIHSEQAALTQLGNKTTSEQHAIDSINNAMAKGWKGIYPEKQLTNGSKKNNKNGQQYSEDFLKEVVTGLQSI